MEDRQIESLGASYLSGIKSPGVNFMEVNRSRFGEVRLYLIL